MALNVLQQVFEYNQHFVAMMNIINMSRLNPPESGHKHHIIPKCWFKMNNLPIDNSKDNLVLLSYEDHVKVHKLSMLCAATPELKSKMGYAVHILLKGQFKGIHLTEETRKKISEALKGKPFTEEHRRKMSEAAKAKVLSEEHRRKISESKKGHAVPNLSGNKNPMYGRTGNKNPMYGKKHSDESRKKMSEAKKGKPSWNKGIHMSDKAKKKLSEVNKGKRKGMHWKVIDGKRVWLSKEEA